jgi:protein-L-isoaspartate(D-aspartate) O-methyltransferase
MEKELEEQRRDRVESLEKMGYIKNSAIKKAMLKVKREDFVLPEYKQQAYIDTPLPIPGGVTISAPHN